MKIRVIEDRGVAPGEIEVRVQSRDEPIEQIIYLIQKGYETIEGIKDGTVHQILISSVLYFESVESRTYAYTDASVYQCRKRLYELEELLVRTPFLRISKSCIVNTAAITHTKAQFNGRLLIQLQNGEKLLVSKHYIRSFREKMMTKEEGI